MAGSLCQTLLWRDCISSTNSLAAKGLKSWELVPRLSCPRCMSAFQTAVTLLMVGRLSDGPCLFLTPLCCQLLSSFHGDEFHLMRDLLTLDFFTVSWLVSVSTEMKISHKRPPNFRPLSCKLLSVSMEMDPHKRWPDFRLLSCKLLSFCFHRDELISQETSVL